MAVIEMNMNDRLRIVNRDSVNFIHLTADSARPDNEDSPRINLRGAK